MSTAVCFCRLGSKLRSQSPGNTHSPTRYQPKYSTSDRRAEEKTVERETKQQKTDKKITDNNIGHPASRAEPNVEMSKSGSYKGQVFEKHFHHSEQNKNQSLDGKNHTPLKTDSSEKKVQGNAQNGESKQGATDKDAINFSALTFKNKSTENVFLMSIRTSTMHSESCSRHNKCRRGYEDANRAQASGPSTEGSGRKKAGI